MGKQKALFFHRFVNFSPPSPNQRLRNAWLKTHLYRHPLMDPGLSCGINPVAKHGWIGRCQQVRDVVDAPSSHVTHACVTLKMESDEAEF